MSNYTIQELTELIEYTRKQMVELSKVKSFRDTEMIESSQKLDSLLNELERLKAEKKS